MISGTMMCLSLISWTSERLQPAFGWSHSQRLLPNGIYPSEMSAGITAALRDSPVKGSRWWSCSVFFTLTPSGLTVLFMATNLQPPFGHCHSWAAKASAVLFEIEGSRGTSPFSCFVERDEILTSTANGSLWFRVSESSKKSDSCPSRQSALTTNLWWN